MKRENGFYWVKWGSKWDIAEWIETVWLMAGDDGTYQESFMYEVDERIIINPNE